MTTAWLTTQIENRLYYCINDLSEIIKEVSKWPSDAQFCGFVGMGFQSMESMERLNPSRMNLREEEKAMKKVANDKVYDTNTANLVAGRDNECTQSDFHYCAENLYPTKKENCLLYGEDGANTLTLVESIVRAAGGRGFRVD